ncbi:MAG: methyltransferase domain-containing protein [Actinobacteria bacterium]|nr:methyltransferase domain-containing protein [Actinomycetota bacterium]
MSKKSQSFKDKPIFVAALARATVKSDIADLALRITGPGVRRETVRAAGPAGSIADLCTGTGSALLEYARKNPDIRIVTIDRDPETLGLAGKRLSSYGYDNIEIIASEVDDIPVPSSSFELVNISFGLHENHKIRRAAILGECLRILMNGGKLVVTDYREVKGTVKAFFMRLFLRLFEPPWVDELFGGGLAREIRDAGFSIEAERCDLPMTQLIIAKKR